MHQSRVIVVLALALVVGLFFAPPPADAARASQVKFWASEFKVTQVVGESVDGKPALPRFDLEIKGRASSFGGEKVDFEFKVPDAMPWLDLLQVCSGASARLSGEIGADAKINEDGRTIQGEGKLAELTCRHLLK